MAEVGQVLAGRYRIVELLGQGGMATIYRGHDTQLGRDVAIKVLRAEYGRDPAFVARFRQEAQSAAALSHPNVVNVFDFGMEAGDPFIVMELIDGGDLAGALKDGPLEPLAAARIAQQIFEALDAAHARGIVHRDIKVTNVLLTSGGRAKVADFGIARAFSEAQLTMPGTTLGSVHYFSPEQARGEMVTSASDVYSGGLVLFEMLTGRRAWTGDSAGAVAVARLTGDPPVPSSVRPGIPQVLDMAVERALSRVPADRPTAGDMAAFLGRYIVDPQGAAAWATGATGAALGGAAAQAGTQSGLTTAQGARAVTAGQEPGSGYYGSPPRFDASSDAYTGGPAYGTVRGGAAPRRGPFIEDESPVESAGTWGWIAAVLGVLVLFAGGVLLFLLLTSRPGATPAPTGPGLFVLPSFVGLSLEDAQRDAEDLGLILTVGGYQESAEEQGTVISQDPAAGGQVLPGSRVSVILASLTSTVLVPDVRLQTEAALFALLAQSELLPGLRSEEFDATVPATLLIRTNPRAGISVARGTAIDYVVSLGAPPTPSPLITSSPLITPSPTPTLPPTPTPTPFATPPPPPTLQPTPTPTLPPPTPAPTFVTVGNYALTCEMSLSEARTEIESAGLVVGVLTNGSGVDPGPPAEDWLIYDQSPPAGTQVAPGTAVDLSVRPPAEPCPPPP